MKISIRLKSISGWVPSISIYDADESKLGEFTYGEQEISVYTSELRFRFHSESIKAVVEMEIGNE